METSKQKNKEERRKKKTTDLSTGSPGSGRCADPETVLEPPGNTAQEASAASAGGLSPLGLLGPVVCVC